MMEAKAKAERAAALHTQQTQVDAQRRYTGGDSDHSILVEGLDFALLEQNKAVSHLLRQKNQDDDALEEVFAQTTSTSSAPTLKKRPRADIIKEFKEKRASENGDSQMRIIPPKNGSILQCFARLDSSQSVLPLRR